MSTTTSTPAALTTGSLLTLINLLGLPVDTEILVRDLNGLDWVLAPSDIVVENGRVVINTENINKV